jgi:putative aminopeptidase FrvX
VAKKKAAPKKTTSKSTSTAASRKQSQTTVATAVKAGGRNVDIDIRFIIQFLTDLLNIPSPTGYTTQAIHFVRETFANLKLDTRFNTKGALIATWQGKSSSRARAMTAHVDTLGAMVKEIDPQTGRLKLSRLGGFSWTSVEGEGCSILTEGGKIYRGTILARKASVHVHGGSEVEKQERSDENMEVRLDVRTRSAEETRKLGIEVGDFVAFDPRVEVTDTGFIRSRHLDDKASVACIAGACKALLDSGLRPSQRTTILISNYEEVGHGAATGLPNDVKELLTVDMAAVGRGQNSDEFSAGICVKDSGGPYHLDMRRSLVSLAQAAGIPYKLDIYPFYGSDGEAAWRAGADVMVGLAGPGVDASHSYERTHKDSLIATTRLLVEFMLS